MTQLICLVGPTGVGKTSILERLQLLKKPWSFPLSTTTRAPRPEEEVGGYYHFLSDEEFTQQLEAGEFIENAVVHGKQYGLRKADIECCWDTVEKSILIVDIQGVKALKELYGNVFSIFILPENFSDLEERLALRNLSEEETKIRLDNAREEMKNAPEVDTMITNFKNALDDTVSVILKIIERGK